MGRVHVDPCKFSQGLVEDLIDYAEHEFRLDRKAEDGATERQHRESAARQFAKMGIKPKVVPVTEGPPFPDDLDYLWAWFQDHSLGVMQNGNGPATVTWDGLSAWSRLVRVALEPWEARTMVRLGVLRANIISEKMEADRKRRAKNA